METQTIYDYKVTLASGEVRTVRVTDKDLGEFAHNQAVQAISKKILQAPKTFTFELEKQSPGRPLVNPTPPLSNKMSN